VPEVPAACERTSALATVLVRAAASGPKATMAISAEIAPEVKSTAVMGDR
jgi:hypothetical protein